MKIKFATLIILFFCLQSAKAQTNTTLQVSLFSAKNDSLNNITVQLYKLPDTSLGSSKLYRGNAISFTVTKFTKYIVRISSATFEAQEKFVGITDKPAAITLPVKRKVTSLQSVVVVSKKPLIKQEDDKTIVDAETLANSSNNGAGCFFQYFVCIGTAVG